MNYRKEFKELGSLYESTRKAKLLAEDDVRLDPREGEGMGGDYDAAGLPLDEPASTAPAANAAAAHSLLQQEFEKHQIGMVPSALDNEFIINITSGKPGTKVKIKVVGLA